MYNETHNMTMLWVQFLVINKYWVDVCVILVRQRAWLCFRRKEFYFRFLAPEYLMSSEFSSVSDTCLLNEWVDDPSTNSPGNLKMLYSFCTDWISNKNALFRRRSRDVILPIFSEKCNSIFNWFYIPLTHRPAAIFWIRR